MQLRECELDLKEARQAAAGRLLLDQAAWYIEILEPILKNGPRGL